MLKVKIFIDKNLNQYTSYYDTRDITHEGNIVFQPSDNTCTDWVAFKSEISDHCSLIVEINDDYESISIMPNDYLSLMEEEDDYADYFDIKFIKLKEIKDLEDNSVIEEYHVPKKDLLKKLKEEGFKRELTDSQMRNVLKMIKYNSAADFSVPGAGKTTEALAFYAYKKDKNSRLFITCPKNAFNSWDEELKFCFEEPFKLYRMIGRGDWYNDGSMLLSAELNIITNYEKLRSTLTAVRRYSAAVGAKNLFVILDESHRIKNPSAWQSQAVKQLSTLPKYKLILTGTPCPKDNNDLVHQFEFLFPTKRFNEYTIQNQIKPHFCRTTKQDLFDLNLLPKWNLLSEPIPMNEKQRKVYNIVVSDIYRGKQNFDIKSLRQVEDMKRKLMWLIELASNPKLLLKYEETKIPIGLLANTSSAKMEFICKEVRKLSLKGYKSLIWTNFTQNIDELMMKLMDLNPTFIDGRTYIAKDENAKSSDSRCREFRINHFLSSSNCSVMIANPAAASESMSLHHGCYHAFYLDRTFNAAQYLQSRDRIHRITDNIEQEVFFIEPYHAQSIDNKIRINLDEKIKNMEKILNDKSIRITPKDFQGKDIEEVSGHKANFDINKITNEDLIDIIDDIEFLD
jgi:SNF2 family DNA or RNA helicase